MHCRNTLRAHGHLVTASLSKFSDSRILTCGSGTDIWIHPTVLDHHAEGSTRAPMPPFRMLRGLAEF
jgi:hypothetical protein